MKHLSPELIASTVFFGILAMCACDTVVRALKRRRARREQEELANTHLACATIIPPPPRLPREMYLTAERTLGLSGWREPGKG